MNPFPRKIAPITAGVAALILGSSCALTAKRNDQSTRVLANGVEFTPVPIDVRDRCYSTILVGTDRFRDTAYLVPKPMISVASEDTRDKLIEVIPLGDGTFILQVGLHLATEHGAQRLSSGSGNLYLPSCDIGTVTRRLRERGHAEVNTLPALPIEKVEISVPGLSDQIFTIGSVGGLLDYQGRDLVAEFTLADERALKELSSRLVSRNGLGFEVKYSFDAQKQCRVTSNVKFSEVAKGLRGRFQGQVGKGNRVTDVDARAALSAEVMNQRARISVDAGCGADQSGTSMNFQNFAQTIVDSLLEGADVSGTRLDMRQRDAVRDHGGFDEELGQDMMSAGQATYDVNAVINAAARKGDSQFSFNYFGESLSTSYTTGVRLRGIFDGAYNRTFRLTSARAGRVSEPIRNTVTPNVEILAGDTVRLSVLGRVQEVLNDSVQPVKTYLNKAEVMDPNRNLKRFFPLLQNEWRVSRIRDRDFGVDGGRPRAQFMNYFLRPTHWATVTYSPRYLPRETTDFIRASDAHSISVSFSEFPGRWIPVSRLSQESRDWTAQLDGAGRLTIQANIDLGVPTFRNTDVSKHTVSKVTHYYVQEMYSAPPVRNLLREKVVNRRVDPRIPRGRSTYTVELKKIVPPGGVPSFTSPVSIDLTEASFDPYLVE